VLAVVLDLFSRQVIGWSMKPQMTSDLAIDALLMAVWRRKPKQEVMIHSDQGEPVQQRRLAELPESQQLTWQYESARQLP
ncbi:DDE-type integrase/transposase/recombinase, partial [Metapseudomonas otitidis]|uniref:DDE-type integrase/transposase/recombinase n=1 Tax=Metapseudomonas otitidis TaxID=319939 RepID=UPI00280A7ECB